ncbi:MAG: hypothetical protein H7318_17055 [Oligoflexus sp.]|nr:hypothetical protein [Oligoflexus sp.]
MKCLISIILAALSFAVNLNALAATNGDDKKVTKTIAVPSKDPWDFDVHGGAGFGTFTNKLGVTKNFGGFIAGIALFNENLLDYQTGMISADFLLDAANNQVIRKGFSAGTNYALIGGKKRTIERLKMGTVVSQSNYSLSWNNRITYDSFTVTPTAVGLENLDGSNASYVTGIGFNIFITGQTSLSISLMNTVVSFAASVEKSTQKSTELGFALRSYLK